MSRGCRSTLTHHGGLHDPQLIRGTSQQLFGGMDRLSENSMIVLKNKSHSVTAKISAPDDAVNGVIVAQGGAFGGWSLYALEDKVAYCYNLFGLQRTKVVATEVMSAGDHQVRVEFGYDGGGLGKGGSIDLHVDGVKVAEGRVDATVPMVFSGDEATNVGSDTGTPVSDHYTPRTSRFTGKVDWVQLDVDAAAEDLDHLITAEERLKVAMARQ